MVDNQGTSIIRPYVMGGRVDGADAGPYDPGPVPTPEPRPSTTVLPVGSHATVAVTTNIGYTGYTGLTVTRGETSVTVALPTLVLATATPVPYVLGEGVGAHASA